MNYVIDGKTICAEGELKLTGSDPETGATCVWTQKAYDTADPTKAPTWRLLWGSNGMTGKRDEAPYRATAPDGTKYRREGVTWVRGR